MLNLVKTIEDDSLRGIGKNYKSKSPQQTVIGGNDIFEISEKMRLKCYKIGGINIKNAFVLYDGNDIFYVYVNPKFNRYRNLFSRFVEQIPKDYHIDHILAKNLAGHYIYNYVLIGMIPDSVNIEHGRIERKKPKLINEDIPSLCFMDDRIFNKILSRNSTARQKWEDIKDGYYPKSFPKYGLTLKQRGLWNITFGFYKSKIKLLSENHILVEVKKIL